MTCSRGPMLMQYRDIVNKPTAGIRLDIPAHLMGVFKTLETFGFSLKRRHGRDFRKYIKFDEFSESLYIQVGFKKEGEEMNCTKYSAQEAREGLKKLEAKRGPRFDFLSSPPTTTGSQSTSTPRVLRKTTLNPPPGTGDGSRWNAPTRKPGGEASSTWRPPNKPNQSDIDSEME